MKVVCVYIGVYIHIQKVNEYVCLHLRIAYVILDLKRDAVLCFCICIPVTE